MNETDSVFQRALSKMLIELFDGPPGEEAYVLNPGDPGLFRQLDSIDAETASKSALPGKTTIAAHVDHLSTGLESLNRWAAGDPNPWSADPNASWRRLYVTDEEWRRLRTTFRKETEKWRAVVDQREEWDDVFASAAISTAAHTAYHIGAIRQLLQLVLASRTG